MSKEQKKYEIRRISDLANIPLDRLPGCIKEFKGFLDLFREISEDVAVVGSGAGVVPHYFTWIDDGKSECTVELMVGEKGRKEEKQRVINLCIEHAPGDSADVFWDFHMGSREDRYDEAYNTQEQAEEALQGYYGSLFAAMACQDKFPKDASEDATLQQYVITDDDVVIILKEVKTVAAYEP